MQIIIIKFIFVIILSIVNFQQAYANPSKSPEEIIVENFRSSIGEASREALQNFDEELFLRMRQYCLSGIYRSAIGTELKSTQKIYFHNTETKQYFQSGKMRDDACLVFIMLTRGSISKSIDKLSNREEYFWSGVVLLVDKAITDLNKISSKLELVGIEKVKLINSLQDFKSTYVTKATEIAQKNKTDSYRITREDVTTFEGRCTQKNKSFDGRYSNSYGGTWTVCNSVSGCASAASRHDAIVNLCN